MIARYNLEELIHYILASESESFLIEGGENESIWEQYLHNQINKRQLMKRKIIKFSMVVLMSEFQVDITFHKDAYNIKQIALKTKKFCQTKIFNSLGKYIYNCRNSSWNLTYSTGQGGMFTSAGKILTFRYR